MSRTAAVGGSASGAEYSFVAPASEVVAASFYFANIGATTVWVDAVSVEESDPGRASAPMINVGGVTSSASFLPGIVANAWLAIQGADLSPVVSDTWEKAIVGGKLPTSLDGVGVRIGNQQAFVYFISPRQINVVAPEVGVGSVQVTVTTTAGASAPVAANVVAQAPAFFAWPGNQPVATRQDGSFAVKDGTFPGLTTAAARPGDVLILWGTGFGVTNPGVEIGVLVPADRQYNCSPATVKIGATDAPVYGCALADGDCALKVTVNGTESPDGVILAVKK